nr:non-structural maintenance of chromosomes element 1 homolog [Aedes albopictus]XP_029735109.1 non-structural maintenance of chromosomes element 1 homolog [Aedes albopictus]
MNSTTAYSNVHRGFLQACVLNSTLTLSQAFKIISHLAEKYAPDDPAPTDDEMDTVVAEINAQIGRFGQRIVLLDFDPTQKEYYIFANLSDTPLDRVQEAYTEAEVDFFRVVLHELACTEHHRIQQIACLNLTANVVASGEPLTKGRAEELIDDWLEEGYLALTKKDIGFGPKTMVEFDRYLLNNFPDHIDTCRLCKEVLFYGVKCDKCSEMLHKSCMKKYIQRLKKCPACNKVWTVALE